MADANRWRLTQRDGLEQKVKRWQDLDWTNAADDAKARQETTLHLKIFTEMRVEEELGRGSFGIAFKCIFPSLSIEPLTVKLPKVMFERPMMLEITLDRKLHEIVDSDLDSGESDDDDYGFNDLAIALQKRKTFAIDAFVEEFTNFEQIYVPRRLKGTEHITRAQHVDLLKEQFEMELKPGRAHIHRIVHFDASVPALFSEQCDGTLNQYRYSNVEGIFNASLRADKHWDMSAEWLRVAAQVGSAVNYMHDMSLAHCDININNVFYRLRNGQAHYLVSDFGLCHSLELEPYYDECRTTEYFEPKRWSQAAYDSHGNALLYDPFTLTVYTFAIVMVNCLKLPNIEFPFSLEQKNHKRYKYMADEIKQYPQYLIHITPLFPSEISPKFRKNYPQWSHIVEILNYDYYFKRDLSTQNLFDAFLISLAVGFGGGATAGSKAF